MFIRNFLVFVLFVALKLQDRGQVQIIHTRRRGVKKYSLFSKDAALTLLEHQFLDAGGGDNEHHHLMASSYSFLSQPLRRFGKLRKRADKKMLFSVTLKP